MVLTPGEIYFIRETDFETGQLTPFTKIGIVRDKAGRGSEKRRKEHQTGNPRMLVVQKVVMGPAVEWIETVLHHRLSKYRVVGEWFHFEDEQLAAAIDMTTELVGQAEATMNTLNVAKNLAERLSDGTTTQPSIEVLEAFTTYWTNKTVSSRVDELQKRMKAMLVEAHERGESGGALGQVREREATWTFDKETFAERHPNIVAEYTQRETVVRSRFQVSKPADQSEIDRLIPHAMNGLLIEAEQIIENRSLVSQVQLAEVNLDLRAAKAESEWAADLAEAQIKVACGSSERIAGVCLWKREEKKVDKVDWSGITNDHSELCRETQKYTPGRRSTHLTQSQVQAPQ